MTSAAKSRDERFRSAVHALDAGDAVTLARVLAAHPALGAERLTAPGEWLRERVGRALDGYFREPYLLWFVAGNPLRGEPLPRNIASLAAMLIEAARHADPHGLQAQLDYALTLLVSGRAARESGVQTPLLDCLIDAGARASDCLAALGAANLEAAAHLIERGVALDLAAALCLGRGDEVERLARDAGPRERKNALIAAAINGRAEAIARLLAFGVDIDGYGADIHPHATALHQAIAAGSLASVQALVAAGARLDRRDSVYGGTPLQWAQHERQTEIEAYLRSAGASAQA